MVHTKFDILGFYYQKLAIGWPLVTGDNLAVIDFLCVSEKWPDKWCGLWWEGPYKFGTTTRNRLKGVNGSMWWEGPYKRGTTVLNKGWHHRIEVPS